MLIDDYFVYQINFEKKYGENTVVLMQVGTFFEFYGVNNKTEKIGNTQKIAELLNIQLTRRNKAILENNRSNCLMGGFPIHSLKRFIQILLAANYTSILIEQVSDPPNPKREITQIYSPGTYIEELAQSDPNNVISIYITENNCYKTHRSVYCFGISSIDLSTGYNVIYEDTILYYEKLAFLEEIYRFIESYSPKEIIITVKDLTAKKSSSLNINDIRNSIHQTNRIVHIRNLDDEKEKHPFLNINYQNEFLKKVFPIQSTLSPIEYLDLEKKPYALISYILLLQFSHEHNERIIEKIKRPESWEYNKHLILYNNASYQLNIDSIHKNNDTKYDSLYAVINKTSTNMGKRLLKYWIMNPIISVTELNKRYEMTELFLNSGKWLEIEIILNEIVDIERLHRKMALQLLHPHEFMNLTLSYDNIIQLITLINSEFSSTQLSLQLSLFPEIEQGFKEFINEYNRIFNVREMGKYGLLNITQSFFQKNIYQEIDNIQIEIDAIQQFFDSQCNYLSNIIEPGSDFVKLENNERDGYFFYATQKRYDILQQKLSPQDKKKYSMKKYNGANIKIVSDELSEKSNLFVELKDKIKSVTKDVYLQTILEFNNKYSAILDEITKFVATIDVIKASAKCAKLYKYTRPIIEDSNNHKSYFSGKEIRHPIIEMINDSLEYVSNDVTMIHEKCNGILLYGVNGSGKSSLSKAIGCNIVLAQIGFFVAATEFTYYPYTKIFTRVNGDDNMFKGKSSYGVEIDELRSILKYSDDRSIVLGDEICKGTEETSALSVISASILRFCNRNVNFILATHFHKLYTLECIQEIKNIKFMHLSITYDLQNEYIIYGRKLLEGPGDTLYGIEIAKFILQDDEFIDTAMKIRNNILCKDDKIITEKVSTYNNKLFVDCCKICGDKVCLDTHHIKEQHEFEKDDITKNKLSNLVVLCEKHHNEVHHGQLEINGYIDTTAGKKLDYQYKEQKKHSKKKYDENQIEIIKNVANKYQEYKNKNTLILKELKSEHQINTTIGFVNKHLSIIL
jgi:DNA mismatch repair protein MutS